jgi:protein O-GlcNAc transferase
VSDTTRLVAERTPARRELGLPEDGFVFCCFNNDYKITAPMFDVWMRLLQQVPSSVLWLRSVHPGVESNLRQEAAARGVAPARVIFCSAHGIAGGALSRDRAADLFPDTPPYNAHTTASDALWRACRSSPVAGRASPAALPRACCTRPGSPSW